MGMASLAYIEERASAALQEVKQEKRTEMKMIAGLRVPVEVSGDGRHARSYEQDASSLRSRLAELGVVPLAVLPSLWWARIVDSAGLVRVANSDSGTVSLHVRATASRLNFAVEFGGFMATYLPVYLVAYAAYMAYFGVDDSFLYWKSIGATTGASFMATFALFCLDSVRQPMTRLALWLWELRHPGELQRMLLLGVRDVPDGEVRQTAPVDFELPAPPDDVAGVVGKIHPYFQVQVAAEPSAFRFPGTSPQKLVLREMVAIKAEWREQNRLNDLADPIVFVTHGRAVAVVAQYGEFPIEQGVVEQVLAGARLY